MPDTSKKRAVVLGASMAGVLAARVLAESYDQVVLVERDAVLGVATPRRGTPHTRHAHGLHARGHLAIEELFPGFTDELVADGAPTGDLGEMRWYFDGRELAPARTGLVSITALRPVVENHLRTRVAALPNVEILEHHDVIAPITTGPAARVTGVRIRSRLSDAEIDEVEADLVVDATGRGSRTPAWLEEWGYRRPDEDRIKVGLAYTTRLYRRPPGVFDDVQSINPVASPARPRGAFFGLVSPDTCILSLTGLLGDHPPTDPDGFVEFARTLPVPDVHEAIVDATPLDDPTSFGFPASVRRRYERLTRFPEGLLVLGDAVCSFNPVYGQGMSVAAIEALALREHLRAPGPVEPLEFLRAVGRIVDVPWEISAGGDLDFPGVEGPRSLKTVVGNAYIARLQGAATVDPEVTAGYMRVAGLMDPPTALMRPPMVARVLRHGLRRPLPGGTPVPARPVPAAPAPSTPGTVSKRAA